MEGSNSLPVSEHPASRSIDDALQSPRRGKAAIDALLPQLSPWELLYLRLKARSFPIEATNANGFATCANLPATILGIISSHLHLHDLLHLRLVSKEWKLTWMQHEVLRYVFRQHFLGMLMLNPDIGDLEPLFLQTLSVRRLETPEDLSFRFVSWNDSADVPRSSAQGRSVAQPKSQLSDTHRFQLDENGQHNLCNPICTEGKVVWQPTNDEFVVDCLRTGQRNRYVVDEDRRKGRATKRLVAASSNLLVIAMYSIQGFVSQKSRLLRVYHDKHKQWKQISLPATLAKCFASSDTIVALTHSGQAFVWAWNDGLAELPTNDPAHVKPSHSQLLFEGIPGVLLPTKCPDIVFLVWVYSHESQRDNSAEKAAPDQLYTIVVVKYERSASCLWAPVQRLEHAVPYPKLPYTEAQKFVNYGEASSIDFVLQCNKVNSYDTFQLGFYRNLLLFKEAHTPSRFSLHHGWHSPASLIQCFNVFSGEFFVAKHEEIVHLQPKKVISCDPVSKNLRRVQLWNRQLLYIGYYTPYRAYHGAHDEAQQGSRNTDQKHSLYIQHEFLRWETRPTLQWGEDQQWPQLHGVTNHELPYPPGPDVFFVNDEFMVIFAPFGYLKLALRSGKVHGVGARPTVAF